MGSSLFRRLNPIPPTWTQTDELIATLIETTNAKLDNVVAATVALLRIWGARSARYHPRPLTIPRPYDRSQLAQAQPPRKMSTPTEVARFMRAHGGSVGFTPRRSR